MLMYKIIESQLALHPEWTLISHDRLCMVPHDGYNRLFSDLNFEWSADTEGRINALNGAGEGFAPKRISSQQPSRWKDEIPSSEQASIRNWVDRFELAHFFQEYVDLQ